VNEVRDQLGLAHEVSMNSGLLCETLTDDLDRDALHEAAGPMLLPS